MSHALSGLRSLQEVGAVIANLATLVQRLRESPGFYHKRDIATVLERLGPSVSGPTDVPNGDDCAVLPSPGGGHLLLAIEGLVHNFVKCMPWFAGYSSVMVNVSDIAAMGGRPLAVVDALWAADAGAAEEVIAGMRSAAERYGVPLVGGHTNLRADKTQLAVAVLGRASRLISSFAATPGDRLLVALDLRGRWMDPFPFWNASTDAPAERLRGDIDVLPQLAEAGLCRAGKDISNAGVLGTTLMLLECSGVGARVALDRLPVSPAGLADDMAWLRWISSFPSFGYVLAVAPQHVAETQRRFSEREIACEDVGEVVSGHKLHVTTSGQGRDQLLWDLGALPFIGANST